MKRFDIHALVLCLAATGATPALAQNLIVNSTFDSDYSGWAGGAQWVADDCCGNPSSGSVNTHQFEALISNCSNVTGSSSYDLTFWSKFVLVNPSLPDPNGYAYVEWMDAPNCGGTAIDFPDFPNLAPGAGAAWHQVGATFVAPANAQSVQIQLGSSNCGLSCGGDTYFDDIAFGPAGTVPVELQSFRID